MLVIEFNNIKGAEFVTKLDSNTVRKAIGYGQHPTTGANYIVGIHADANGKTTVDTFLLKDVIFTSPITP